MNDHKNIYKQYISQAPVGFCHNKTHKGAITAQLLKKHECLAKGCVFFEKNLEGNPGFWHAREVRKSKKKQARNELMSKVVEPEKEIQYRRLKGQKWYDMKSSVRFIGIYSIDEDKDIVTAKYTDGKNYYLYDLNSLDKIELSKEIKEYKASKT